MASRASARAAPVSPVETPGRARPHRHLLDQRIRSFLQLLDHLIDVAPRLADAIVELFVQPAREALLAFGDVALALLAAGRGRFVHRAPIPLQPRALGFERARLGIHAREVRREPLLVVAEKAARGGDDGQRHAEPLRDLDGEAAAGRAVDQPIGRRKRLRIEGKRRRHRRRRSPCPRSSSAS